MTIGDGFLWVVSGGSIVRIDPRTNQLVGNPIRAGLAFESAIAFSEGALWVTKVGPGDVNAPSDRDEVSRINPQTGEIVTTIKVSRAPMSLAITPDTVWVVNFGQSGDAVMRIDPQTNQIAGEPIQTGSAPLSLAVGEGSLWVANHDADTITRIDLATNQVIANITAGGPHRVAYGEGAVWVANWHDNSVTRIDPQTNQVVGEPIPMGFHAGNIAAGLGSVWVTSDYRGPIDAAPEDVVLVRIDSKTNQVVETIPLGGHPIDVEIAGGAVWVSIQGPNRVVRINP
jgi:YVTN family beta-propeller protein